MSPSYVGLFGAIVLVIGAALPARTASHPAKLHKNWFFAVGSLSMFVYAYLNYLQGGSIFFVFLQCLIAVSTAMMLLNTPDKFDAPILTVAGAILVGWSLSLFEGYSTALFVAGLVTLGIGFALDAGTFKQQFLLAVGSGVIAVFSFLARDWIFFGLNIFFSIFSGFWATKLRRDRALRRRQVPAC